MYSTVSVWQHNTTQRSTVRNRSRSAVATDLARSLQAPIEPPRGASARTSTLAVALRCAGTLTVPQPALLQMSPRYVPAAVLRTTTTTTAAARKPHGAATQCSHAHPPAGPRPSTAPRPGPVALLHASPIASWWRRRPILARRNLIRQAVPESLASLQVPQPNKKAAASPPRGSALLLLFCFPPFLFFVPPAPKPDPILTTANLPPSTPKKSKKFTTNGFLHLFNTFLPTQS
ncbi:hypothetical protein THAR02_04197 [Trichoderma harzianum]|uniref:Uncharacterized protein n=1 Tax=Trichoderma harzianum TaxID=5544 RepID=A0A0F9XF60_TRIHA|nr:hypothetical protein THAR02_04197 [Trichoderma harzianum]